VVRYENNDDMYDNPATEAIIDFRWQKARNFFFFLFLRFLVLAFCFIFISWEYLGHKVLSGKFRTFSIALIFIFYYLAIYLLVTELIQLYYHGPRKYFGDIFNSFDICSILLPVIVMSIMLQDFKFSDGFGSVELVDIGLTVGISFSIFFLWIEFVSFVLYNCLFL
jgi:fatty acid desaturase